MSLIKFKLNIKSEEFFTFQSFLEFQVVLRTILYCHSVEFWLVNHRFIKPFAHDVGHKGRDCKLGQKRHFPHIDELSCSEIVNASHECKVNGSISK